MLSDACSPTFQFVFDWLGVLIVATQEDLRVSWHFGRVATKAGASFVKHDFRVVKHIQFRIDDCLLESSINNNSTNVHPIYGVWTLILPLTAQFPFA